MGEDIPLLLVHLELKIISIFCKFVFGGYFFVLFCFFWIHRSTKFNWKHLGSSVNSDIEERCSLLDLGHFFLSGSWDWEVSLTEIWAQKLIHIIISQTYYVDSAAPHVIYLWQKRLAEFHAIQRTWNQASSCISPMVRNYFIYWQRTYKERWVFLKPTILI